MAKFRKHFRKGNKYNDKHPAYIYEEEGKDYKYLSLTHSKYTYGVENHKLKINPKKGDDKVAYVHKKTYKSKKSSFGSVLKGWKFGKSDKEDVSRIIKDNEKSK